MHILITGGTGFIGSAVAQYVVDLGNTVTIICRSVPPNAHPSYTYITWKELATHKTYLATVEALIHLAGYPISKRWTSKNKYKMIDSRVSTLEQLQMYLSAQCHTIISISAIGYYPSSNLIRYTESYQSVGGGFLSELCQQREQTAINVSKDRRGVILRLGNVLGAEGLIKKLLITQQLGLLVGFGQGDNSMSWIDLRDLLTLIGQCLTDTTYEGVYNAVSPNAVYWKDFNQQLLQAYHLSGIVTVPAWLVKSIFGEQSELFLGSREVSPERLLEQGFVWNFPHIEDSLS